MNGAPLKIDLAVGARGADGTRSRSRQRRFDGFATRRTHAEPAASATSSATVAPTPGNAEPATGRRVLYWHDPMTPGPKFDKPGKSPFMNMDLVPVYADEAADNGKVTISSRTAQNLGIRIVEVKEARIPLGFTTTGAVYVDERSLSSVQARVNGYIEKLYVRAQYDVVVRGQALAEVYSPEWLAAQEEYLVLRRSTQPGVESIAQAARRRLALLGVSEAQIQRIEKTGNAEPRVTLYAQDEGVVWEIGAREGMAVNPGVSLFRIASLASVWVNAEVPETEAALVRPGVAVHGHPDPQAALDAAVSLADPTDRIVVFGSFYTVGGVLQQGIPRLGAPHLNP